MRDVTPPATGPTRRLVTVGALGVVAVAMAGCGIRLEDDAPRVPLVPTREPIDAEDALLRLLAAVQEAATAPFVTTDPIAPLLPAIHARQATVLHDALRQRGVPENELPAAAPAPTAPATTRPGRATPGGTSAPSPSASPTAPPRRTVADVEAGIIAAATGIAAVEAELRPALVSLLGQASAAIELGAGRSSAAASPAPPLSPSPTSSPAVSPTWSAPTAFVPLVTATRRATFLLEVAAARSPRKVRDAWLGDISALQALTADLVAAAGDSAPAPDLGQTLPRPVGTPAEAATLATEAMGALLGAFGSGLGGLTEGDPEASFDSVPTWLGTVAAMAHRHGTRLTPFPGLT